MRLSFVLCFNLVFSVPSLAWYTQSSSNFTFFLFNSLSSAPTITFFEYVGGQLPVQSDADEYVILHRLMGS